MECKSCGAQIDNNVSKCPYCMAAVSRASAETVSVSAGSQHPLPSQSSLSSQPSSAPSKVSTGLLGIFLGVLGIHKFVLGYNTAGFIMLGVTILTFGVGGIIIGLIGFIEGIIYLTKSEQDFLQTYVHNKKEWF